MDDTIKLRVINMTKLYGNGDGVKNVDLDVHTGELVTLLGPSGCGKEDQNMRFQRQSGKMKYMCHPRLRIRDKYRI